MTSNAFRQLGNRMLRRLALWTVLALSSTLSGCANEALRGTSFPEDDWSTMPRSMRRTDDQASPTAFSNKACQIERNLGVR